jgi:hypothetical protein
MPGVLIFNITTLSRLSPFFAPSTVLAEVYWSDSCRVGNDGGGGAFNFYFDGTFFRFEDTDLYRHQHEWQRCVRLFFFVLRLVDGAENASEAWKRIFFVPRVPTILEIFTRSPLSFSTTKFKGWWSWCCALS